MNPPKKSKINWTSLIMALIGLAAALNFIPADVEESLTEIALIVGPALVATFRTWFTEKR